MGAHTVTGFQRKAYEAYLERIYSCLKAPGFKLPFETLRELVGGNVEVRGKEMFMLAPWHDVYSCVALLQQAGLVNVSREQQLVVIKTSVAGGQQKFERLLAAWVAGKKNGSSGELPVRSLSEAVEAA
ncbi:MAG: hypothetical protein HYT16_02910 [DPANN group archaeon]|nr:hypothetical protein [DPANN group archaeon]